MAQVNTNSVVAQNYTYGCYSMWPANKPLSSALISNPGIVGILLSASWPQVEPQNNQFVWTDLDNRIAEAQNVGLKVALKIVSSPASAPSWVTNNPNVQMISLMDMNVYHPTYGTYITAPVFWDPIFMANKIQLIQAAGRRYATNENVVAVMAPFANYITDDWEVPHQTDTNGVDQITQWMNAGYSTSKMLAAGQNILDATAVAFPNQVIKMPLGPTAAGLDGTVSTLASSIVYYADQQSYGSRFYIQWNRLSTGTTDASSFTTNTPSPNSSDFILKLIDDHSPQVGMQMLAAATGGSQNYRLNQGVPAPDDVVLQNAINIGLSYHPQFFELWQADSANTNFYSIIENTTVTLQLPHAPVNLAAASPSSTQVNLSWAVASTGNLSIGFELERKIGSNGTYVQIAATGAAITTYSDTGLAQNTTYYYRVRATNSAGDSPYSNETSVTTLPNQPPTIAIPATVSLNPVTGTGVNASVLGSDDAGESNLTYTWVSSGPALASFSPNGTNASKNTVATFTAAGNDTFTVTVRDSGGLTTSSSVSVTVNQTLTTVTVGPASASIVAGGTQQFTATAKDQFGVIMASQPVFTWTTSGGGTIDSSGLFTAGSTAGGPFTIIAANGGKSGTAQITVNSNIPPTVSITSPTSGSSFAVGSNITINANATDVDGTISKVDFYQGSALLGSATTSPYSFTWQNVPLGNYVLTAKATDNSGAVTTSSPVNVTVTQLIVNPGFESKNVAWTNSGFAHAVAANVHTGSYSMRVGTGQGGRSQNVNLTASKTYTLSGWGKVGASGEMGWIGIRLYNSLGTQTHNYWIWYTDLTYVEKQISFTTDSDTVRGTVWVWKNSGVGAYFWADDLNLK